MLADFVRAGAELLDRHHPEGWAHLIDQNNFDMSHAGMCVLGYVYGCDGYYGFYIGQVKLELDEEAVRLYGFYTPFDFAHKELTHLWLSEMEKRLP